MEYKGFMISILILTALIGYILFVSINKNIGERSLNIKLESIQVKWNHML